MGYLGSLGGGGPRWFRLIGCMSVARGWDVCVCVRGMTGSRDTLTRMLL